MLLLTVGVSLGQHRGTLSDALNEDVPLLPTAIMCFNSVLSSLGAVYTERVLKASQSAVLTTFATNLHMSAHTLLMNGGKALVWEATELPRPWKFGAWTWAALFNEAVNGILVAALMRHADSIVKNYAFAASIFLTAGLSVPLLNYWPQLSFFAGAVLVLASMYLYTTGASSAAPATNGSALQHINGEKHSNGKHTNGKHVNGTIRESFKENGERSKENLKGDKDIKKQR